MGYTTDLGQKKIVGKSACYLLEHSSYIQANNFAFTAYYFHKARERLLIQYRWQALYSPLHCFPDLHTGSATPFSVSNKSYPQNHSVLY